MATKYIKLTQTASQGSETEEVRKQFNALLVLVEGAATLAAIQTGLQAGTVKRVEVALDLPAPHQFPSV